MCGEQEAAVHVELYMKRHGIFHLLTEKHKQIERSVHDQALVVITSQLTKRDQRIVMKMNHLHSIWEFLVRK